MRFALWGAAVVTSIIGSFAYTAVLPIGQAYIASLITGVFIGVYTMVAVNDLSDRY